MKQLLVFTSFLLCIHVCAQNNRTRYIESQSIEHLETTLTIDSKITDFIFKKVDENRRIVSFTSDDVLLLEQFFLNQTGVLACKSHITDKHMQVISRANVTSKKANFDYKKTVTALRSMGYIVIGLRQKDKLLTFAAKYKPVEVELAKLTNTEVSVTKDEETLPEDCTECGRVEVSQDLLNQFKEADYGEQLIEFNLGIPDVSSNMTNDPN